MTLRRNSNLIATMAAGLFISCGTTCFGQSLGDIARQERERKEQEPSRANHVYTNDDLKKQQILVPEDQQRVLARKEEQASGTVYATDIPAPVLPVATVPYEFSNLLMGPTTIALDLPLEASSRNPVIPRSPALPTDAVEPPNMVAVRRRSRTAGPPAISMSLGFLEPLAAPAEPAIPVVSPRAPVAIEVQTRDAHTIFPAIRDAFATARVVVATPSEIAAPVLPLAAVPYAFSNLLAGTKSVNLDLPLGNSAQKPVARRSRALRANATEAPNVWQSASQSLISLNLGIFEPSAAPAAPAFPGLSPETQLAAATRNRNVHTTNPQPSEMPSALRQLQPATLPVSATGTYHLEAPAPIKTVNPTSRKPLLPTSNMSLAPANDQPAAAAHERRRLGAGDFTQPTGRLTAPATIRAIDRASLREEEALRGTGIRVERGDSLWKLAQEHLGSGKRWRELAALNPKLTNPNLIRIGQWLNLPEA